MVIVMLSVLNRIEEPAKSQAALDPLFVGKKVKLGSK